MPPDPPSLHETQARFYDWVTGRMPITADEAARLLGASEDMPPAERVGIYARMYVDRIGQVLAEIFPKLLRTVGDDAFGAFVSGYLRARAPAHPMLQHIGRHFAAFVGAHPGSAGRPWLPELAALEWARFAAIDAPDSAPLRVELLRALDGAALAALPLRLVAAHAVVECDYAVATLWRAIHEEVRSPPAPRAYRRPVSILVWRRDGVVMHRRLSPFEAAIALLARRPGATFADACELAASERLSPRAAARLVFEAVGRFVSEEALQDSPVATERL